MGPAENRQADTTKPKLADPTNPDVSVKLSDGSGSLSVEPVVACNRRKSMMKVADLSLRSASVAFLAVALSAILTSAQNSFVQVLGFSIPVSMKWTRSQPFEFLVIVEIIVCAYSILQFILQSMLLVRKAADTRKATYLRLAADQVCAYLALAAAAAAAGAARMNRAGFQAQVGTQTSIHIPSTCSVLPHFCSRAAVAISFTLLSAVAVATSAALDVYILTLRRSDTPSM